ncbi:MAG: enoyl-CoA hydratase/isomerase family protein [Proteobacteria bacterium]|nr:enoyl-CoA hydratase/isomerase family protein [Pseudomonadota bacterium]MBI3499116.1 enoyl-CoA hydratase/isomerase family protein [Pseudomonadota bacterium]
MAEKVLLSQEGPVAVVTLNEPERRNPLALDGAELLFGCLGQAMASEARAVVVTGAGGHFCSGGDIRGMANSEMMAGRERLALLHRVIRLLITARKPVLAAVEGAAFGAGVSLALATDHVIAAGDARFCASFNRVGLMADLGLLYTLPLRVGHGKAKELLLFGDVIDAPDALRIGLIDRMVEPGKALTTAIERATLLASGPPLAMALTKAALARAPAPLEDMLQIELDGQTLLRSTTDHAEGQKAFFEKRMPQFKGN